MSFKTFPSSLSSSAAHTTRNNNLIDRPFKLDHDTPLLTSAQMDPPIHIQRRPLNIDITLFSQSQSLSLSGLIQVLSHFPPDGETVLYCTYSSPSLCAKSALPLCRRRRRAPSFLLLLKNLVTNQMFIHFPNCAMCTHVTCTRRATQNGVCSCHKRDLMGN